MKKYFIIILFFIASCDPYTDVTFLIKNKSNQNISVFIFDKPLHNDTIYLKSNKLDTLYSGLGLYMPTPEWELNDSIIITSQTKEEIKYYPSDTLKEGKSFFKEEYWTIENPSKRVYIYTFEINDDDFK